VLAAAAVLIGAFILAQGSGDDDTDTPTTTQAVTTTAPATTTTSADHTGHDETTLTATTTAPAEPKVPTVVIKGGKPVGGVQDIEVAKGDDVRFTVRSDVADEIHVHGYDLMKDVEAGGSVTFDFPATIDGKFEVELEKAGEQIVSLTVNP
jgi:hypothetical protein